MPTHLFVVKLKTSLIKKNELILLELVCLISETIKTERRKKDIINKNIFIPNNLLLILRKIEKKIANCSNIIALLWIEIDIKKP
jgi:hypothetical protein